MHNDDYLDVVHNIKERAIMELDEISKKDNISPTEWKSIGEVIDVVKDCCEIVEDEVAMENGYSKRYPYYITVDEERDGWSRESSRNPRVRMNYSSAGRRRDSMGRYKDSERDSMISKLETMLTQARTESERDTIEHCIRKLEED